MPVKFGDLAKKFNDLKNDDFGLRERAAAAR